MGKIMLASPISSTAALSGIVILSGDRSNAPRHKGNEGKGPLSGAGRVSFSQVRFARVL